MNDLDYDAVRAAALRCRTYAAQLGQGGACARQHGADIELLLHFMQTGLDGLNDAVETGIAQALRLNQRATELERAIGVLRSTNRRRKS